MNAAAIARGLRRVRRSGAEWIACCPAHEDNNPSLSFRDAEDQVLVHCHAGCSQDAVVAALKDLGLWPEGRAARSIITATYDYTDKTGKVLYQVCRCEPKRFLQRYPDGMGGWTWKKYPDQVLYHLPEVLENPIIFVVEGERDAETLREYGFVVTTNAGGANAPWLPQFTDALREREVILIPDNDHAGRQRVLRIARALKGNVLRRIILTLEGPGIKDVSDWFSAGHSEVELIYMLDGEEVSR
jgi:5S rRNA maturation endonuclease (ribonuclease M5)/rhodanese-related sulfurtransferase